MNKILKGVITASLVSIHAISIAQIIEGSSLSADTTQLPTTVVKNMPDALAGIHMNFLLRSSLEIPNGSMQSALKQNEARFEVLGTIVPNLDFRVRWRLNRSQAPKSLDNSPGSIDIASVNYAFGKEKKWSIQVGKQAAFVGSWEFEKNPTFEYQYSEFVNFQANIFMMGMKLGYQINENHAAYLQLHNTYNEDFTQAHAIAGYSTNGNKPSKSPMGVYTTWRGKMFDNKFQTFWSYDISKFASGQWNHSIALGNKLVVDRFEVYLDLQTANLALDHPNIASPSVNNYRLRMNSGLKPVFANDLNYKSAILRVDYEFVDKWFITGKGIFEAASQTKNNSVIGRNFRENIGLLAGIEYQPIASQQMKMFGYYYHNKVNYKGEVKMANTRTNLNLFAVGILYFINVF
ncbi:hypothetical protein FEM33_09915 [Dyadobacter flavalbus]|uniref:Porin n=1 Tax=Dyadobacter flavalbus TaxID=2579942 RepID=A0A5M8QUQ9_9BACT|nr:porin [Dyadobacter flavalbus]KAA6439879.1 hypothetical protein FEM33_09915 [Dyadobacter flavalbus]